MNLIPTGWPLATSVTVGGETLVWCLMLAVAVVAGQWVHRHLRLPQVVGYALTGMAAGWMGWGGTLWPLQGLPLLLLELGVAVVLFDSAGRLPLRWLRHNPMVLVQSLAESTLSAVAVFFALRGLGVAPLVALPLALVAMAASPVVLARVVHDNQATGPVTDRALALSSLSTLYALTLGCVYAVLVSPSYATTSHRGLALLTLLGVSVILALALYAALRWALHGLTAHSDASAMAMLGVLLAAAAAAHALGASAPLVALLAGLLLKHRYAKPWGWPQPLRTVAALITLLMLVLVAAIAAQAPWGWPAMAAVAVLVVVRLLGKSLGVGLGHVASGISWPQALWTGCAMAPMSGVALLVAVQAAQAHPDAATALAGMALPAIGAMELLGAIVATWALHRAGECRAPLPAVTPPNAGDADDR